jgi:hypothetical protein
MDNFKKGEQAHLLELLPTELSGRYENDLRKTYFTRIITYFCFRTGTWEIYPFIRTRE